MRISRLGTRVGRLLLTMALAACAGGDPPDAGVLRDTLANGATRIRYQALATAPVIEVEADLEIGVMDGEEYEIFADIRGIEVTRDGTIYILDYQASEVRAFGPDGTFQGLLATPGEGPGGLTQANGMQLDASETLWIQDHGKWSMIGVDPAGNEVARYRMPVQNYGYMWNGSLDARGRLWKPTSHSDEERASPPQTGLIEGRSRSYWVYYDPDTEVLDSVFMGEGTFRTFVSKMGGGYSYRRIPFSASPITIVNPAGGFWATSAESYRVARLDERGDTVLVIEAALEPDPVTSADQAAYVASMVERDPSAIRAAEAVVALMPETKPVIDQLFVDDEDRLWVREDVPEGESRSYDVFSSEGDYRGSVHFSFSPAKYFTPRVRYGHLYTFVLDELDVPTVVRAQVPPLGG